MPAFSAPPAPRLSEGTVVRAGGRLLCDLGLEAAEASPAASCLLAPREGDRVLVCRAPSGCWVLAVLERREAAAPAVVALPEDAEIRGGRIAVASDTLEVVNSGTVVSAARLTLRGILARADFTFLTVRARQLVRLASSFLARSVSSRVEAEGSMRVAAPDLRLDASETLRARAGTVDLKADGAAKVDGATVQLG
jgi:hypothetical protein